MQILTEFRHKDFTIRYIGNQAPPAESTSRSSNIIKTKQMAEEANGKGSAESFLLPNCLFTQKRICDAILYLCGGLKSAT